MSRCEHFDQYMAEQRQTLQRAVDEDKWYLSERAGFDVGHDAAMDSFVRHHLDQFAQEFRVWFCRERCPGRQACDLARRVGRLPTLGQLRDRRLTWA